MNIKIDPEFRELIPPLTDEEYRFLEKSLLKDGCREPIAVWKECTGFANEDYKNDSDPPMLYKEPVIVDGHNRYEICRCHGIPFQTVEMDFESRDEAIIWIIKNLLRKRNLSDYERIELYERLSERCPVYRIDKH